MMWSQVKARFESGLADGLRGNLSVHVTSYGGLMKHGRGWLTWHGNELVSVEAPGWTMKIANHQKMIWLVDGDTCELGAACGYVINHSIEDALSSKNSVIAGLAMLDARCGARRLRAVKQDELLEFAQFAYALRMKMLDDVCTPWICEGCGKDLLYSLSTVTR